MLLAGISATLIAFSTYATAFNINSNANYASYYGQNSAKNQKSLGEYCQDAIEDVIVLAFMQGFPNILLNFANACETTFEGSTLLNCPNMAKDIQYCQSQGKAVILSMGGASGAYGFTNDSEAVSFADTMWNTFFKGSSDQRPFGDAVLDGVDLDIEGGGGIGYPAFINQLRSHYTSDPSKSYYITSAPQCPFPDAYLGPTLDSAWFDMVYVQFYNNYCGLNAYPSSFNFGDWDNWAKTKSVNKDVKIFIGAPGSPAAASSGYVDGATLKTIYNDIRSKYSSLGGIMTWDISQSRTSGIATEIRAALGAGEAGKGVDIENKNSEVSSAESTTSTTSSSSNLEDANEPTSSAPYNDINELVQVTSDTSESTIDSSEPTNDTSGDCPVDGASCAGSQQGCNGQQFALCANGKWYLSLCAPGTICTLNNGGVVCDWPNGRSTNTCGVTGG
ncbi:Chitinase 2 [Coemansia brasiliensis]|uniref:chitinase n=1 Tax=Coemansia brasiliensis TaxID=2650707 RepID=A0A9W8IFW0_9FUNG|nr:Chitinase 2 [Coemansia brasiliensis]